MRYKSHISFIIGFSILFLFTGCSNTVNDFKVYKKEFLSSYNTKDTSKNLQKNSELNSLYKTSFSLNEIIDIRDQKLSKKQGQMGLWLPSKFIKENGGGLYFLDKYDADKKVIVFIHGAGGNGIEWREILNYIDLDSYQPLLFSYPSGLELEVISRVLADNLKSLAGEYSIEEFIMIAHSMGGLVAKKSIQELNKKTPYVKTFITLSTPWEGHEGAKDVKKLPYYIPSWDDMRSNSSFITGLKNKRILKGVDYYLLFGYKGEDTMFSRDNDGVISLKSQLSLYAQKEAKKVYGFNETHVGILVSKEVTTILDDILNNKFQKDKIETQNTTR